MTIRIIKSDLENQIKTLNQALGLENPAHQFELYCAYNAFTLMKKHPTGGTSKVFNFSTRRELFDKIDAMIVGARAALEIAITMTESKLNTTLQAD